MGHRWRVQTVTLMFSPGGIDAEVPGQGTGGKRPLPQIQRLRQIAQRRKPVRGKSIVAGGDAIEQRQSVHTADEAQDRIRVIDCVIDMTLLGQRGNHDCRYSRTRPPAVASGR